MKKKRNPKKEKNVIIKVCIFITFLLSILITNINQKDILKNSDSIVTSSTTINLSNKTIGWGIKRNENHEQPDVGSENKELLEKYDGICLGNKNEKTICLTFDEGYEAGYTEQILDTLKENEVTATFFITAHYVNTAPKLVQRMINEGHIVGNHTPNFLMSGNNINVKC